MGLDISYYSDMAFDRPAKDIDCADAYLYPNDMAFGQSDGIAAGAYDSDGEHGSFRAGSYGGYNAWRSKLAELIGYAYEEAIAIVDRGVNRNASIGIVLEEADEDEKPSSFPFAELLYFSDAEGFIGPKTSAKLAGDFAEWEEKAKEDPGFFSKYSEWKEAFDTASRGGCVVFH